MSFLELARALGARNTAGRIFPSKKIISYRGLYVGLTFPYPIPIPSKNRHAVSACSMPLTVPPPYAPAERAAKINKMMVEAIRLHFRE